MPLPRQVMQRRADHPKLGHLRSVSVAELAQRFVRNDCGNVVMMFAVLIVPLTALSIGVLDYGRANGVKRELQTALDAGLSFAQNRLDAEDIVVETVFQQAFKANVAPDLRGTTVTLTIDRRARRLEASAEANVPVHVIGVLSGNQIAIEARAALNTGAAKAPIAELERRAPEVAREVEDAQAHVRSAMRRLLPPSDALRPGDGQFEEIDPEQIKRLAEDILQRLQH